MRRRVLLSTALTTALTGGAATLLTPARARAGVLAGGAVTLPQAHAHNDYEHPRPLFDALARGFTSVEVDVHLVGDQLLVGHTPFGLEPSRTLQSLYLEPLRRRASNLPNGFNLLVEVKTGAERTWARLDEVLRGYADVLTTWTRRGGGWSVDPGPVTVVVSGHPAVAAMAAQSFRVAAVEGRAADAAGPLPPELVPEIGVHWGTRFRWRGIGRMRAAERDDLHRLVDQAHAAGRRIRFWGTRDDARPARAAVWNELLAAGVDRLNTDDLDGLARFLRTR